MEERLQKLIAATGFCSRRKAEELIEQGIVQVNGITIKELGSKFDAGVKITIDGKEISKKDDVTIAFYKPVGYLSTNSDPFGDETVFHLLPKKFANLKIAGRLDKNSQGLMILSSNGELINKLTHPKFEHIKTYEVAVKGELNEDHLEVLKSGKMKLDDYILNPMNYEIYKHDSGKTWIRLKLSEGRKRQIRRVMDYLGFPVLYLCRTAIGKLELGNLERGKFIELTPEQIQLALS
jgi:23S rRNA pseudouridine2605 synthase